MGWLEDGGGRLLRAAPQQLLQKTGLAVRSAITEINVFLSLPLSAIFDGTYETFMSRLHLHSDKQESDFSDVWFDALCRGLSRGAQKGYGQISGGTIKARLHFYFVFSTSSPMCVLV